MLVVGAVDVVAAASASSHKMRKVRRNLTPLLRPLMLVEKR